MSYTSGRKELELALKSISYSKHKDIEILINITEPNSILMIDDLLKIYNIIPIFCQEPTSSRFYDQAIATATGSILLFQKAQICHVDDILSYISAYFKPHTHLCFSCYIYNDCLKNQQLYKQINTEQNYLINYTKICQSLKNSKEDVLSAENSLNYITAIYRSDIERINVFPLDFASIIQQIETIEVDKLTICQWIPQPFDLHYYTKKNEDSKLCSLSINWPSKIPKYLHIYCNIGELSIDHYLTIQSFTLYNPMWYIYIYTNNQLSTENLYYLRLNEMGVNFIVVSKELQVNIDSLKWDRLYNKGGFWSDFSIIYIKPLTGEIFRNCQMKCKLEDIEVGLFNDNNCISNQFFFSAPGSVFFKALMESSQKKSVKFCFGKINETENNVALLDIKLLSPYEESKINNLLASSLRENENELFEGSSVGIYFYKHELIKNQITNLEEETLLNLLITKMETIKCHLANRNLKHYDFIPLYRIKSLNHEKNMYKDIKETAQLCKMIKGKGFNINGEIITDDSIKFDSSLVLSNDYNGCYVNSEVYPKVSIVFAYHNRREQFLVTLKTIEDSQYKNLEIIIVDDGSDADQRLEHIINNYKFLIKLRRLDPTQKSYCNPCIPYNYGFELATGKILIIQNPEVCHINDIISYIVKNLTINDYMSFSCFALDSFKTNECLKVKLSSDKPINVQSLIQNLQTLPHRKTSIPLVWYNHPTNNLTNYHFCAATFATNIYKIRGFSLEFKDGYCYDDEDLLLRMRYDLKLNIETIPPIDYLSIHQYHPPSVAHNCIQKEDSNLLKIKWQKNKTLFETKLSIKKILSSSLSNTIPKIFNCYWDLGPLSYLSYLTLRSFSYYNPDWCINIYTPTMISVRSSDKKDIKYEGKNYMIQLNNLSNINIIPINFQEIGFSNDAPEKIKSIYLRWHILSTIGGIWSDLCILYINSIEESIIKSNPNFNTLIFNTGKYYPIGFFMSKPNNEFFAELKKQTSLCYIANKKQAIGTQLLQTMWPQVNKIIKSYPKLKFRVEDQSIYLPFEWNRVNKLFESYEDQYLTPKTIGIYWFGDSQSAVNYQNNFDIELKKNVSTISSLVNKFLQILKNDNLCQKVQVLNTKFVPYSIIKTSSK